LFLLQIQGSIIHPLHPTIHPSIQWYLIIWQIRNTEDGFHLEEEVKVEKKIKSIKKTCHVDKPKSAGIARCKSSTLSSK
jgi:hypothetical protein